MPAVTKSTIESQQIQVYVVLARLLNMSRAAEELGMTPSGVSHCLRALEQDLGCQLFERTSRKIELTRAGREFLSDAEEILARMVSVREKIHSWGDWREGQLRIGANSTACRFILPRVLREFRESFPGFSVKIEPYSALHSRDLVTGSRLDLAIGPEPPPGYDLTFDFLAEDELCFIVHPLHPWAQSPTSRREGISAAKFIVSETSGDVFKHIDRHFKRERVSIQPHIEVASEDAVKHFVELDMGVGILPRWIVAEEIENERLVALPLGKRALKRRWGVFYAKSHKLRFAENLLVSVCRSVLKDLVGRPGAAELQRKTAATGG